MERGGAAMKIRAHAISAGKGEGEAVVYNGPFSFMGVLLHG
jgi:predicted aconitase with swiveling domain